RSFKNVSGVRSKNQPLSWTEGSDINHAVISVRQLLEKVVLIDLRFHINILLGSAQGFEVTIHVFRVRIAGNQMADHERRIYHLAEAQLFHDVGRRAKEAYSRNPPIHQQRQPIQKQTAKVPLE